MNSPKAHLWIDPRKFHLNEEAVRLLKQYNFEFEIIEIENPDGDTFLPAFYPNEDGAVPASGLFEIKMELAARSNAQQLQRERREVEWRGETNG